MVEDLSQLSNAEILRLLKDDAQREHAALPRTIRLIQEADGRNAFAERGYTSLFDYCVRKLRYSEDEAYRRIHVARGARLHPEVMPYIDSGTMPLAILSKLVPHLNRENAAEMLAKAQGKTWREVEALVAPRLEKVKRDRIRAVIQRAKPDHHSEPSLWTAPPPPEPPAPLRYQVSFEATAELKEALARVRDLLWHKFPFGQLEGVLLEVLIDWLARHDPVARCRSKSLTDANLPLRSPAVSRQIRCAVWSRDGGRCTYAAADGTRCQTRRGLEIDHIVPRAAGGSNALSNLRLLCRTHNQSERRRLLGEGRPDSGMPP